MKKYLLALTVCGFAVSIGTGGALAGGASDSTGDGSYCYLFFSLPAGPDDPERFAQVMVNDSEEIVVVEKVLEFTAKYIDDEGGTLLDDAGNLTPGVGPEPDGPFICGPQDESPPPPDCGGPGQAPCSACEAPLQVVSGFCALCNKTCAGPLGFGCLIPLSCNSCSGQCVFKIPTL